MGSLAALRARMQAGELFARYTAAEAVASPGEAHRRAQTARIDKTRPDKPAITASARDRATSMSPRPITIATSELNAPIRDPCIGLPHRHRLLSEVPSERRHELAFEDAAQLRANRPSRSSQTCSLR